MLKQKRIRERGRPALSRHFKQFKEGERAAIITDLSVPSYFPDRAHGKTGVIAGKRGKSYIVLIREGSKEKKFIVKASHLKKLKA